MKKSGLMKKAVAIVCSAAICVLSLPLNAFAAETDVKSSGTETVYCTIASKRTGKVMEVPGGNKNNGAVLQQWDYAGSDNQKWSFQKVDDTYYKIVNKATGKVADVKDAATNNGARVHQWDYVGKDNQLWSLKDCGDGYYQIISKQSGKCLDIAGISSNNGAQIQIWSDVNGDNQKWKITELERQSASTFTTITSKRTNKVMEVPGGNYSNGAIIQQWDNAGSDNQKWSFQKVDDTYYKIVNKATGKVADVKDAATNNGARVHQWDYVGKDNQLWSLKDCGDGYYQIISKQSGKCLDIAGISSNNGAQIQIWSDVNGDNQKWKIDLNELKLYAHGRYAKASNSMDISWVSTDKSGTFEVMSSTDGNTYSAVATLADKDSYSYPLTGSLERLYFKVVQTTSNNITAESNRFEMIKTPKGYECQFDDTDGDGLPDAYEKLLGTDPLKTDTDGDGLTDYQELMLTNTSPLKADSDGNGISDAEEDPDKDGLTNLEEVQLGTNPLAADTDGDGLKDGDEVHKYKTDPLKADTDGDGINDGDEIRLGLDPNKPDTNGDGVPDSKEKFNQTLKQPISNDCDISEIDVSFTGTGYINSTTSVSSVKNSDKMSANVVGLVGEPFEFKTTSKFSSARICFKINKANLKDVSFKNLAILWYDESNQIYRLLDTQLDEKNSTVSSEVTHFSKYMVVDKEKWFAAWHKELNYFKNKYVNSDTVLALDCSGSMCDNDPITQRTHVVEIGPGHYVTTTDNTCGRIEASENYITTMDSNDKATLIAFDESPTVLCGITSDKQALTSSLQRISSYGGTNFDNAMQASIDSLNGCKDKNRKTIIFLSDGQDSISDSLLEKAKKSNITIYSIGLGSDVDDFPLQSMANYTGGKYYRATTADDLSNLFTKISMADIDKTDTDGDGLYDIFETAGMKLANGRVIYTDPLKADTDGDGLKDGEEIIPVFRTMSDSGIPSDSLSKTSGVYFVMKSDPTMVDSDGDGYNDNVDKYPLGIWQPTSELAKVVDAAGFLYDPQQNIIYSRMDPPQRKFGYCPQYDEAAGLIFNIDDEPICFYYQNDEYMIELWKGQYGIETGGEVGVYYQDSPISAGYFKCVDDNSLLNIHFTFVRDDSILFTRGPEDHWWETGFRWGVDTPNTDDLTMEVRIDFSNCPGMVGKFTNELTQMGYRYTIDHNVVKFVFGKPHTPQPGSRYWMEDKVSFASSKLVDAYNLLKQRLGITTDDPNVIEQAVLEKGDSEAKKTLNDIEYSMRGMLSIFDFAA